MSDCPACCRPTLPVRHPLASSARTSLRTVSRRTPRSRAIRRATSWWHWTSYPPKAAAAHGEVPVTIHGDFALADRESRRDMSERSATLVGPRVGRRRRGRVPGGGRVARHQDRAIRVHVERAMARVVRFRDHRHCWYVGAAKALLQTALSVLADNFVRLLTPLRSGRVQLQAGRLVATG